MLSFICLLGIIQISNVNKNIENSKQMSTGHYNVFYALKSSWENVRKELISQKNCLLSKPRCSVHFILNFSLFIHLSVFGCIFFSFCWQEKWTFGIYEKTASFECTMYYNWHVCMSYYSNSYLLLRMNHCNVASQLLQERRKKF